GGTLRSQHRFAGQPPASQDRDPSEPPGLDQDRTRRWLRLHAFGGTRVSRLALLPRSIAGRTTLPLIAGMLLVTAAGIAVSAITLLGGGEPTVSLVDRVATLAAVAEGLPPRERAVAFAGAEQVGLRVRDLGDVTPTVAPPVFADWFTDRMWAELQRELTP